MGSGLIVITIIGAVASGVASLAIPLESWSSRVPEITDRLVAQWNEISQPIEKLKEVEEKVDEAASKKTGPVEVVVKPRGVVTNMISSAPDVAAWILLFFGTLFFFLATRCSMRAKVIRNCATLKARLSVARLFRDVERHLSRYIATTATVNAGLGDEYEMSPELPASLRIFSMSACRIAATRPKTSLTPYPETEVKIKKPTRCGNRPRRETKYPLLTCSLECPHS